MIAVCLWGLGVRGTIPLSLKRLEAILQLEAHDHEFPPPLLPLRMHALRSGCGDSRPVLQPEARDHDAQPLLLPLRMHAFGSRV